MDGATRERIADALWRIYRRPPHPEPWEDSGNLPWDDPEFSRRMLREHLDESHGAASRVTADRALQIDWMWRKLALRPGHKLLDMTCGPGLYAVELARRGVSVTGVDFSPASIDYAKELAKLQGVAGLCQFIRQDVRTVELPAAEFDAALFIFGQLAVFRKEEADALLAKMANGLRPGGRLVVELHDPACLEKGESRWWRSGDSGLWGDRPFFHLGESIWQEESSMTISRFYTIHLENGRLDEITLCDQAYAPEEMLHKIKQAGFKAASAFPGWEGTQLSDAQRWIVYLAER